MQESSTPAKKSKVSDSSEVDVQETLSFYFWNQAYVECLQQSFSGLEVINTPDCVHTDFEVQGFFVDEDELRSVSKRIGDHLYLIESDYLQYNDYNNYFQVGEVVGRYVSRTFECDRPIFSVQDYFDKSIRFKLIFQTTSNHDPVSYTCIMLYDNYETVDSDKFKLRFEWWQPIGNKKADESNEDDRELFLQNLQSNISSALGQQLSSNSQSVKMRAQSCQFANHPVKMSFEGPLYRYTWNRALNNSNPNWARFNYESLNAQLTEILASKSATDLMQEYFSDVESETYIPVMLSYWDAEIAQSIQLPKLNFSLYQGHIVSRKPLGDTLVCLHFSSVIPDPVKSLVSRYTIYLSREISCNALYNGTHGSDIFLVMSPQLDCCYGYVLFKEVNRTKFLNECNKSAQYYLERKSDAPFSVEHFHMKFQKNMDKWSAARQECRGDYVFLRESDSVIKYRNKTEFYDRLRFFAAAKNVIPRQDQMIVKDLELCWIHPFFRQRGIMRQLWNHFHTKFSNLIEVDKPSYMMREFVKKNCDAYIGVGDNLLTTRKP